MGALAYPDFLEQEAITLHAGVSPTHEVVRGSPRRSDPSRHRDDWRAGTTDVVPALASLARDRLTTAPWTSAHVLLDILVVLVAAKLAAELAERIGVPAVVGEIVAGIIIGPSVLGLVGGSDDVLRTLGEIGVILLLLEVGLEMDLPSSGGRPGVAAGRHRRRRHADGARPRRHGTRSATTSRRRCSSAPR